MKQIYVIIVDILHVWMTVTKQQNTSGSLAHSVSPFALMSCGNVLDKDTGVPPTRTLGPRLDENIGLNALSFSGSMRKLKQ